MGKRTLPKLLCLASLLVSPVRLSTAAEFSFREHYPIAGTPVMDAPLVITGNHIMRTSVGMIREETSLHVQADRLTVTRFGSERVLNELNDEIWLEEKLTTYTARIDALSGILRTEKKWTSMFSTITSGPRIFSVTVQCRTGDCVAVFKASRKVCVYACSSSQDAEIVEEHQQTDHLVISLDTGFLPSSPAHAKDLHDQLSKLIESNSAKR